MTIHCWIYLREDWSLKIKSGVWAQNWRREDWFSRKIWSCISMLPCSNLLRTLSSHSPLFPLPMHTASPLPPRLTSVRPLHCSDPTRNPNKEFDPVQFESERLRLDEKARNTMAAEATVVGTSSGGEKQWKWRIRKRVWDMMEAEGIARNPRPVHHRIPNFEGAVSAADAVWLCSIIE